jgi:D-glycero-D-manno-heptose 1,7-bisphosphate phosphatase
LKPAIFLDRDGVINQAIIREGKPYPPRSVDELVVESDVKPALARLKQLGYLLIGITNQPDVARGQTSRQQVEAIHNFLLKTLPLDEIRVCYHDNSDGCHCRKPLPGLILDAAKKWQIQLADSYMIGDRWRDIEAGQAAGCQTIWIDAGYHERAPAHPATFRVNSFSESMEILMEERCYQLKI